MLGLYLIAVAGCQSWHATPLAPNASRDVAANTRLVELDGQSVNLETGHVTADSIVGEMSGGQRIALPRDSVASVEVSSLSWPRTLGVVYGGLVVVGLRIGEKF